MKAILIAPAMFVMTFATAVADEPAPATTPEAAIRTAVGAYVEAFNKADAKGLATKWSPDAVYTNRLSGEEVVGREAIEQQFAAIFSETKGMKLEATTDSVQFISPGVAVEHGTAKLIYADQTTEESRTTSIFIKRDGLWLLDRVTEESVIKPLSHYEQLKELEWMVGKWTDQDDVAKVTTECNWKSAATAPPAIALTPPRFPGSVLGRPRSWKISSSATRPNWCNTRFETASSPFNDKRATIA